MIYIDLPFMKNIPGLAGLEYMLGVGEEGADVGSQPGLDATSTYLFEDLL